jgi:hypothetical protein
MIKNNLLGDAYGKWREQKSGTRTTRIGKLIGTTQIANVKSKHGSTIDTNALRSNMIIKVGLRTPGEIETVISESDLDICS